MPSVFVKFFEDAVERTEAEIEELRLGGLLRDQPPIQSAAQVQTPPVARVTMPAAPQTPPVPADKKE
jgi:hypothetical protein